MVRSGPLDLSWTAGITWKDKRETSAIGFERRRGDPPSSAARSIPSKVTCVVWVGWKGTCEAMHGVLGLRPVRHRGGRH